ncbi:MAG: N(4)-(beta-N-acetylglucosaminyl)-L-asparaginase [Candidatus Krumholzibacteriota bacterium]|nr:N(4)-(beta-N-acetylglucosaminyl)-L-asparaginase [Candidatus Krumholzibacteriota bacterium]
MPLDRLNAEGASRGGESVPTALSTWPHGLAANEAAWAILAAGGTALDAVEAGARVTEDDPGVTSVGYGGYPDAAGRVTLDASIMGPDGLAGAVAFVDGFRHPVSIARAVMERTDHVMLAGAGAEAFARRCGFEKSGLLTDRAREAWRTWKRGGGKTIPPGEDHDTIGVLALDATGDLAGACTTSGAAFKLRGRVGDSPIPGAGLFVDNEVGAAAATGRGEAIMRVCGTFLVVEHMRRGGSPRDACAEALERIVLAHGGRTDFQVAFVALDRTGNVGACSLREGFEYAIRRDGRNELVAADSLR